MTQQASFPIPLAALVDSVSYREGWTFRLADLNRGQGCSGLTLVIDANVIDSISDVPMTVRHYFIVPAAAYNRRSWMRWLLDRCIDVETHEACEFFRIDGARVYAPHHAEGENPYTIFEIGTLEDAKKTFRER